MGKFKSFTPRVDTKRRLVMTRFYAGVNNSNSFCYMIHRITKKGTIDKKFKFLYCFGTDDYSKVKEFHHANTGELMRTYKTSFKGVFKVKDKFDVLTLWKHSQVVENR
tara:strand:- start:54 stop:377 length:324 start_codon:yes stop_codon:yes gene_type:complete